MKRDVTGIGGWKEDSNRPHKKLKNSPTTAAEEKEKEKEKEKESSSVGETSKGSFDAAVHKSSLIKSSSWVTSRFLGKGSYGSVYLATSKSDKDKTERAIKTAEISEASSLMREKRILMRLRSSYVVRCYGDEIALENTLLGGVRTNYNLILEYCSGKSLADLMKTNGGRLSETDVKVYARDILYGLFYIHMEKIIHCDIKPENILLTPVDNRIRPNGYVAKIGDFGLAMEKGSTEYGNGSGHKRGTKAYMAPEIICHGVMDYGVDTWSFGCTVLKMLSGQTAWAEHGTDLDSFDMLHLIALDSFIPYIPDWLSQEAQDFLSKCLVEDPDSRWKISSLIDHPFLN